MAKRSTNEEEPQEFLTPEQYETRYGGLDRQNFEDLQRSLEGLDVDSPLLDKICFGDDKLKRELIKALHLTIRQLQKIQMGRLVHKGYLRTAVMENQIRAGKTLFDMIAKQQDTLIRERELAQAKRSNTGAQQLMVIFNQIASTAPEIVLEQLRDQHPSLAGVIDRTRPGAGRSADGASN